MPKAVRLLPTITPDHYYLAITTNPAEPRYTVREQVKFRLHQECERLVFHAVGLEITKAAVDGQAAAGWEMDEARETVAFRLRKPVAAGEHTLEVEFSGTLNETLHGFYRSPYQRGGETAWLAMTQFEAVHAREAFICIDEPAAKAVFELEMTIPEQLTAISNNDVASERVADGRKIVRFSPTPKMSTYLVAYLVGEFESIEAQTAGGVTVRVQAVPGRINQGDFALDVGRRSLDFFADYFGLPYPLPKLDMVAVPEFGAGAMENWGAVTYRETDLLLDPAKGSLVHRQRVAETVAHELAHQWFGNLVTMTWWNDLWLNEGFATWCADLARDQMYPEWQIWQQFVSTTLDHALQEDSLANTHAIEVEVDDPREIDQIFDAVSYQKGASVVRMLHDFLGDEAFRTGLGAYLKRRQYGNATTVDLWHDLEEASGQPVKKLMAAWTKQAGYPLVALANGRVTQRRFYRSAAEAARAHDDMVWPLPFSAVTPDRPATKPVLLEAAESAAPLEILDAKWVKPNAGQVGVYRTWYTHGMIEALREPLASGTLPVVDRFGVVSDVFATTEAGLTDAVTALELLAALRSETSYVVWDSLSGGLARLLSMVVDDERLMERLEGFGRWLVEPNRQRLGWQQRPGESLFDTMMRPVVLSQAIRFGDTATIEMGWKLFNEYLETGAIDPDLRAAVLYAVARQGDAKDFEAITERYRQESSPQAKLNMLVALGHFRKPELIQRYLEYGLSPEVRKQDTFYVFAQAFRNRQGRQRAWEFMQEHWQLLLERYGRGGHMLEHFPALAGMAFARREMAKEVEGFFMAHPHPSLKRPVAQALEEINLKADWFARDQTKLEEFLAKWEPGDSANR